MKTQYVNICMYICKRYVCMCLKSKGLINMLDIIRHICYQIGKLNSFKSFILSLLNLAGNIERRRSSVSGCIEENPFLLHQQVHHGQVSILVIKMKPLIESMIQIAEGANPSLQVYQEKLKRNR